MAEPDRDVPPGATNRESGPDGDWDGDWDGDGDGEAALRAAVAEYGDDYAAALEHTDALVEVLETAILVVASADDEDVEHVTDSLIAVTNAADAISTEQAVTLADEIGEHGDDLAAAVERLVELERSGDLADLIDLARLASDLELDEDAVGGTNRLLGAVGEVERRPATGRRSRSGLGLLRSLLNADVHAGLRYVVSVVEALGSRLRNG